MENLLLGPYLYMPKEETVYFRMFVHVGFDLDHFQRSSGYLDILVYKLEPTANSLWQLCIAIMISSLKASTVRDLKIERLMIFLNI